MKLNKLVGFLVCSSLVTLSSLAQATPVDIKLKVTNNLAQNIEFQLQWLLERTPHNFQVPKQTPSFIRNFKIDDKIVAGFTPGPVIGYLKGNDKNFHVCNYQGEGVLNPTKIDMTATIGTNGACNVQATTSK